MKWRSLSTEGEDALLNDDHDPKEKAPTAAYDDPMFSMIHNVSKTRRAMEDSGMLVMNQSMKSLHSSHTDDQLDPKRRKHNSKDEMSASSGSDEDGDDSHVELQALCGTAADKTFKDTPRARLEQGDGGNGPLLSEIAEDLP